MYLVKNISWFKTKKAASKPKQPFYSYMQFLLHQEFRNRNLFTISAGFQVINT